MIEYGAKFKEDVLQGILKASNAIASTYGPHGNTVYVKSKYGGKKFTKDGYSVALALEDINNNSESAEDIGINMVVECSKRVNELCGDSSTGVVVIFNELINQIRSSNIRTDDINDVVAELKESAKLVIEKLESGTKSIESLDEIIPIGVTSSGDYELGKLIAELVWRVRYNKIRIEQSKSGTYTEVIEGIQVPVSAPSLMLSNELYNARVFITSRTITDFTQIQCLFGVKEPILIICDEILPNVYNILEKCQELGQINCTVIRTPYSGIMKEKFRYDLAKIFGTSVNTYASEVEDFIKESSLGRVKHLSFYQGFMNIILDDSIDKSAIIKSIESEPEDTNYYKEIKEDRISVISGNIGVLHLYADSESEYKELRDRVDDSINSCKCALKYGYSKGAGRRFLEIIDEIPDLNPIIKSAIMKPSRVLPEPTDLVIDSTWSLIQCVKVAVSMAEVYLKLNYAVVNPLESLLDRR